MKTYKLKDKVIAFVRTHQACREELCKTMNIRKNALDYHLENNVPNGSLTKFFALEVISKYANQPMADLLTEFKAVA